MQLASTETEPTLSPTAILAEFAAGLRYEQIDAASLNTARRHVLDTVGAIFAGADQHATRCAARALDALGAAGKVPVPGLRKRYDPLSAAYIAGTAAHGLELDDGYRAGSVHPGCVIVPALISAAQGAKVDGKRWITAVVIGYEIVCRLAAAMHPHSRYKGFHNTPVMGVMGAAAAVGALKGFDAKQMADALGLAASSASGIFAFLRGGGEVKRTHPGQAAREGIQAAFNAAEGMVGPKAVLEIEEGYFDSFAGTVDLDRVIGGLEEGPEKAQLVMAGCYIKPYAACRHLHPGIDAILDIRKSEGIAPEDVEGVEIGTYEIAVGHANPTYGDMLSAQMSYQFCMATALERGGVDLAHFDDTARGDDTVLRHVPKITAAVDAECQDSYPRLRAARVRVRTKDGTTFERLVEDPYGSADNPVEDDALSHKFRGLAAPSVGDDRAEAIEALVRGIDGLSDVDKLIDALAG
jgi:2-methylcitrate dehydratase PrpD